MTRGVGIPIQSEYTAGGARGDRSSADGIGGMVVVT